MVRVQFYPGSELEEILSANAEKAGVSMSTYVSDLLSVYFGLTENETTLTQLTEAVLKEVEAYVREADANKLFDLLSASKTYRSIPMTEGGKPSSKRAGIGRSFASKAGKHPFERVRLAQKDGRQILSENNALMYEIV